MAPTAFTDHVPPPIDADVREEYWALIRKQPKKKDQKTT